jgi:hypothetical protein
MRLRDCIVLEISEFHGAHQTRKLDQDRSRSPLTLLQTDMKIVLEPNITPAAMLSILQYVYTGKFQRYNQSSRTSFSN